MPASQLAVAYHLCFSPPTPEFSHPALHCLRVHRTLLVAECLLGARHSNGSLPSWSSWSSEEAAVPKCINTSLRIVINVQVALRILLGESVLNKILHVAQSRWYSKWDLKDENKQVVWWEQGTFVGSSKSMIRGSEKAALVRPSFSSSNVVVPQCVVSSTRASCSVHSALLPLKSDSGFSIVLKNETKSRFNSPFPHPRHDLIPVCLPYCVFYHSPLPQRILVPWLPCFSLICQNHSWFRAVKFLSFT